MTPRSTIADSAAERCLACGANNRHSARFCRSCAGPLVAAVPCPACGVSSARSPDQKFCDDCGHPLTPAAAGTTDSPHSDTAAFTTGRRERDGERKTVTVLFADIEGSVALIAPRDPEEARAIIDPALELMMAAVRRYGGDVDTVGDGVIALFGARIAYEDHAQRGIYAALQMQEDVRRYTTQLGRERGVTFRIRIGLNTGEVVVRTLQESCTTIGHATNLAARMERVAAPDTIVVSENTYRLTEDYAVFRPLGPSPIKGLSEPVAVYEVLGPSPLRTRFAVAAKRGLGRFVGRDVEMQQIRGALELADQRRGQVVAVVGDPGSGKSRLFQEVKVRALPHATVLECFALPYGEPYPYLAMIEMLRAYFGVCTQDDTETRRRKVTEQVTRLDLDLEDAIPYLHHFLGVADPNTSLVQMDPQIRRQRTFGAIKRLLVRESLNRLVLVIVHDLQWLDPESRTLLDVICQSVPTARMLVLVNYRPEYAPAGSSRTFYTQLPLGPLQPDSVRQMLTTLLGAGSHVDRLKQLITDKAEGNPFFIEEIVQGLFERGAAVREPDGVVLTQALTEIVIPATVQGVLAGRIDRLAPTAKALLQTLAVIGREFRWSLVREMAADRAEESRELLSELEAAEFIYEQPGSAEPTYTFKHALTREVAYGSLLMERRRDLHEQIARAIETVCASLLDDHYAELAHHYGRSGNRAKSVQYRRLAAQQAMRCSAHAAAITHLNAALDELKGMPDNRERIDQELAVQVALGAPLALTKGYAAPDVGQTRARARELCREIGDTPQLFPVLFGLWAYYLVRGEIATALELARELLELADRVNDPRLLVEAHRALGPTLFFTGAFASARIHLEAGIAVYDRDRDHADAFVYGQDPGVSCLAYLGVVLWHLGYPDAAVAASERALALARDVAHPFTEAFAFDMAAAVRQFRREAGPTEAHAEVAIALATEHGFPLWTTYGMVLRGWARIQQRKCGEGEITEMRDGLTAWRATGARVVGPYLLEMTAESYGALGRREEALTTLGEALAMVEASSERWHEAELLRLRGEMLVSELDHAAEGMAVIRHAIDTARAQEARALELRAVVSWCRRAATLDQRRSARDSLAMLLDGFAEGRETVDLSAAALVLCPGPAARAGATS